MVSWIEKYINRIETHEKFDFVADTERVIWYFYGDGEGDFENNSNATTLECIDNYITDCEKQIFLAKKYRLMLLEKNNE